MMNSSNLMGSNLIVKKFRNGFYFYLSSIGMDSYLIQKIILDRIYRIYSGFYLIIFAFLKKPKILNPLSAEIVSTLPYHFH